MHAQCTYIDSSPHSPFWNKFTIVHKNYISLAESKTPLISRLWGTCVSLNPFSYCHRAWQAMYNVTVAWYANGPHLNSGPYLLTLPYENNMFLAISFSLVQMYKKWFSQHNSVLNYKTTTYMHSLYFEFC